MRNAAVWALPLLLVTACTKKQQPSETPATERNSSSRSGYGEMAWSESTSITPREVCEHLVRMIAAEAGMTSASVDPQMMAECEAELGLEAAARGTDNWNSVATCVLQSRTKADIDYCNRTYPLPSRGGPRPSQGEPMPSQGSGGPQPSPDVTAVSAHEVRICEHMIEVLMLESAAEMGTVPTLTSEERQALVDECAQALALEQRPARTPADYERMLACIQEAGSSEQMRACE